MPSKPKTILLAVPFLVSCQSSVIVNLADRSDTILAGDIAVNTSLKSNFLQYCKDLDLFSGYDSAEDLTVPPSIMLEFLDEFKHNGQSYTDTFNLDSHNNLKINYEFSSNNFAQIFSEANILEQMLTVVTEDDVTTVSLTFDDDLRAIMQKNYPFLVLPAAGESKASYLQKLTKTIASSTSFYTVVENEIVNAYIQLVLVTPRSISYLENGVLDKKVNNRIYFNIKLLDLLYLEDPFYFSVSY